MEKGPPGARDGHDRPATTPTPMSAGADARPTDATTRSRGRHAAITRNLYSWSNYKSWADKIKTSFDPGGK